VVPLHIASALCAQLAREFGKLVNVLWREQYKYVAPSSLKNTISRFAPRFAGYDQHDAQVCQNGCE
jgi:hypothetical protein